MTHPSLPSGLTAQSRSHRITGGAIGSVAVSVAVSVAGMVRAVAQFARPLTMALVLVQGWFALVVLGGNGLPHARHGVPLLLTLAAAVVALCGWYAHAVAVNDLTDVATDRINLHGRPEERERPLINGSAGRAQVHALLALLLVVTAAASALVAPRLLLAVPFMFGLNYAYSVRPWRLAGRGGLAQAVLPAGYVLVPAVYAWALTGWVRPQPGALIMLAGLYVMFAGRLMLKDVRDLPGDTAVGKRTFLVRHGLTTTAAGSAALLAAGALIMLAGVALSTSLPRAAVLAVALPAGAVGVAAGLRRLLRTPGVAGRVRQVGRIGRVSSGWLFCCLLAVVVPAGAQAGFVLQLLLAIAAFGVSLRLVTPKP